MIRRLYLRTATFVRFKAYQLNRWYRGPITEHRVDPWRRATRSLRVQPNFLVIGEMKCGTSSLFAWLMKHPAVGGYPHKEVCYFDLRYGIGDDWYRSHFPLRGFEERVRRTGLEPAIGEASPHYFFHPHAAGRVRADLPDARLIVLFRDPVARAYSHYQHARRRHREPLGFAEALAREEERLGPERERLLRDPTASFESHLWYSYASRGRYAESLRRWLDLFPREQVLIIRSEDLFERPADVVSDVLGFLELPDHDAGQFPPEGRGRYDELDPTLAEELRRSFETSTAELSRLAGRDFRWERTQ